MKFCLISELHSFGRWDIPGNELRAWAYALEGDVHCGLTITDYSLFDQYDVTMVELKDTMLKVVEELKRLSRTKVIGVVEAELLPPWPAPLLYEYIQCLNTVDMVGMLNTKAYPILRALTVKPVHYIGLPYPLQWARENRSSKKQRKVIELGSTPSSRGGMYSMTAFNQLNVRGVCYPTDDHDTEEATLRLSNGLLTYKERREWREYFVEHSEYDIGLHLDDIYTWGRYPLDCAAADMPCVSTYSHTQSLLFPALTIRHYETDRAVDMCRKLLKDRAFHRHVTSYAQEVIEQFDIEVTKTRFLNLL